MSDEIKLPPLPDNGTMLTYGAGTLRNYARLAVEQDRARREGREPLRVDLELFGGGAMFSIARDPGALHHLTIRWTPERVWIESERNRELARMLRQYVHSKPCQEAADALDGGER